MILFASKQNSTVMGQDLLVICLLLSPTGRLKALSRHRSRRTRTELESLIGKRSRSRTVLGTVVVVATTVAELVHLEIREAILMIAFRTGSHQVELPPLRTMICVSEIEPPTRAEYSW